MIGNGGPTGVCSLDDRFAIAATWPGLVKIDVQSSEADVLRGGARMLRHTKPVIIIEANDNGISALLEDWGARKMGFLRRDQIWAWE